MSSNTQNISSAGNVFFPSAHAGLAALVHNGQRAAERLTELNVAAAAALTTESLDVAKQYLRAESPQALLLLTLAQAQASVAKSRSYARHVREIMCGIGGELADMKIAVQKLSLLAERAAKKSPAAAIAALTLSDSEHSASMLAPSDVTEFTEFTEFTDIGDAIAAAATLPSDRVPPGRDR
jgi:phasin family protein